MKITSKRGSDSSSSDSTSDDAGDLTIHGLEGIVGQRLSGEVQEKNHPENVELDHESTRKMV